MEVFLPFLLNSFFSHAHTQGNVMLHCHFCIDVGDRNNAECDNGRGGSGDLLSLSCRGREGRMKRGIFSVKCYCSSRIHQNAILRIVEREITVDGQGRHFFFAKGA